MTILEDTMEQALQASAALVSSLEEEVLAEKLGAIVAPFCGRLNWVVQPAEEDGRLRTGMLYCDPDTLLQNVSNGGSERGSLSEIEKMAHLCFEQGTKQHAGGWKSHVLEVGGSRFGVLLVRFTADNTESMAQFFKNSSVSGHLLTQMAAGIRNAFAVSKIRRLTVTDDVSGLYNSRFLHEALEKEHHRASRYQSRYSIIFFDLDHFKYVNDGHGHLVGTDVLRETAGLIAGTLRDSDLATRYGGDEFVVILPETEKSEALIVAGRILESVRSHSFGKAHGLSIHLTASLGVAAYPDDSDEMGALIEISDQAMYMVKEICRNGIATREGLVSE